MSNPKSHITNATDPDSPQAVKDVAKGAEIASRLIAEKYAGEQPQFFAGMIGGILAWVRFNSGGNEPFVIDIATAGFMCSDKVKITEVGAGHA